MSDLDLQTADTARRHADDPALGAAEHWRESRRTQLALMPVRLVRGVVGVLAQMLRPTTTTHGEGTRRETDHRHRTNTPPSGGAQNG